MNSAYSGGPALGAVGGFRGWGGNSEDNRASGGGGGYSGGGSGTLINTKPEMDEARIAMSKTVQVWLLVTQIMMALSK